MYYWDAIAVLKEQVSRIILKEIVTEHTKSAKISHILNAGIGREACKAVEKEVKLSAHDLVSWKQGVDSEACLLIGCFQLFSDKLQTSLYRGSQFFHFLHFAF